MKKASVGISKKKHPVPPPPISQPNQRAHIIQEPQIRQSVSSENTPYAQPHSPPSPIINKTNEATQAVEKMAAENAARLAAIEFDRQQRLKRRFKQLKNQLSTLKTSIHSEAKQFTINEAQAFKFESQQSECQKSLSDLTQRPVIIKNKEVFSFISPDEIQQIDTYQLQDIDLSENYLSVLSDMLNHMEITIKQAVRINAAIESYIARLKANISELTNKSSIIKTHHTKLCQKHQTIKLHILKQSALYDEITTSIQMNAKEEQKAQQALNDYCQRDKVAEIADYIPPVLPTKDIQEVESFSIEECFTEQYHAKLTATLTKFTALNTALEEITQQLRKKNNSIYAHTNAIKKDLKERQNEEKRLTTYRQHQQLLDKIDTITLEDLSDLSALTNPIARFLNSKEQGSPLASDGNNLLSKSIISKNTPLFERLLALGYAIEVPEAKTYNPLNLLLAETINSKADYSKAYLTEALRHYPLPKWPAHQRSKFFTTWAMAVVNTKNLTSDLIICAYQRIVWAIGRALQHNMIWPALSMKPALFLPEIDLANASDILYITSRLHQSNSLNLLSIASEQRLRLIKKICSEPYIIKTSIFDYYVSNVNLDAAQLYNDLTNLQRMDFLDACLSSNKFKFLKKLSPVSDELILIALAQANNKAPYFIDACLRLQPELIKKWFFANISKEKEYVLWLLDKAPMLFLNPDSVLCDEVIELTLLCANQNKNDSLVSALRNQPQKMKEWSEAHTETHADDILLIIFQAPALLSISNCQMCFNLLQEYPPLNVFKARFKDGEDEQKINHLCYLYLKASIQKMSSIEEILDTKNNIDFLPAKAKAAITKQLKNKLLYLLDKKPPEDEKQLGAAESFLKEYRIHIGVCGFQIPWTLFSTASSQAYQAIRDKKLDKFQSLMTKADKRLEQEEQNYLASIAP